ncbi:hypothetical protein Asi03nite_60110 [Actinoplanes siamensis]|uniref:Uncharacterized protein n=1 Tax=Actinoplanes siamensis TaxID=1223317 RepID=A0A919NC82_9ACTN|nr:hypothetical protein Asi03nite_60110 [Actinoplanes siamensis]
MGAGLAHLAYLQRTVGNQAVNALIAQRAPSQQTTTEAGPSGGRKRERSESVEEEEANNRQRLDDEGQLDEGVITPELRQWLQSKGKLDSEYPDVAPKKVHLIKKEDPELACWNWALTALTSQEPSYAEFWGRLQGSISDLSWYDETVAAVRVQLDTLAMKLNDEGLVQKLGGTLGMGVRMDEFGEDQREGKRQRVGELQQEAAELYVKRHGMTVDRENPAAWVVCHYTISDGFAGPEHWWIELPGKNGGRVVIQTVPKKNIEIAGENARWHDQTSSVGRSSEKDNYRRLEVPIKALKGRHVEILKAGMAQEPALLAEQSMR